MRSFTWWAAAMTRRVGAGQEQAALVERLGQLLRTRIRAVVGGRCAVNRMALLILLGGGLLAIAAPARAQQCAASCSATSASRCAGTQSCICTTSPRWRVAAPVQWSLYRHAAGIDGVSLSRLESEVRSAFSAWDGQPCSGLDFSYQGTFTATRPADAINAGDGKNRLAWISTGWAFGPGTLGVTHTAWNSGSNFLVDADIEFNDDNRVWTDSGSGGSLDLFSIVLHEVGHFWGANHTPHAGSVMYFAYSGGQKRSPSADDVAQLCCLYPASAPSGGQGAFCQATSSCQGGLVCARPAAGGDFICTRACAPANPSCPGGFTSCEAAVSNPAGSANGCFVAASAPSDLCGFCDSGPACSSGLCIGSPPFALCSSSCTNDRQCGAGFRCATLSSGGQACVPNGTDSVTGALVCPAPQCRTGAPCPAGYHCDATGMCRGGRLGESCTLQNGCDDLNAHVCVSEDGERFRCRQYCTGAADCPANADCLGLSGSSRRACFPREGRPTRAACESCSSSSECPTGFDCVTGWNGNRCYQRCGDDARCSLESSCAFSGGAQSWCACPAELAGRGQPCGQATEKVCGQQDVCIGGPDGSASRCRQACSAEVKCPSGEECRPLAGGSASVCMASAAPDAGTRDGGRLPGDDAGEPAPSADGAADGGAGIGMEAQGCGCGAAGAGLAWPALALVPALGWRRRHANPARR